MARARAGQPLKVLLGLANSDWLNLCGHMLKAISGGAVQIQVAETWSQFIEAAEGGAFDLGFLAPGLLCTEPTTAEAIGAPVACSNTLYYRNKSLCVPVRSSRTWLAFSVSV